MKHYQTRIAFAEQEIELLLCELSSMSDIYTIRQYDFDYYMDKLNQANRIRKHYIAKNYEYKRAKMKDKRDSRAKELGDFNNPSTPLG